MFTERGIVACAVSGVRRSRFASQQCDGGSAAARRRRAATFSVPAFCYAANALLLTTSCAAVTATKLAPRLLDVGSARCGCPPQPPSRVLTSAGTAFRAGKVPGMNETIIEPKPWEHSEGFTRTPSTSLRSRETPTCVLRLSRLGIEVLDFTGSKRAGQTRW